MESFIRSVWILDEDAEYRAAVVMAVESAGYHDIVAFGDARRLLAHRPSEAPALAVIDSWTARFEARRIHRALSGVPLVVLASSDMHDELWRSLGVRLLPKPISRPSLGDADSGLSEDYSGVRSVSHELRARVRMRGADTDKAELRAREPQVLSPFAKSLERLLAELSSAP